jgi:hypothetical protein
MAEDYQEEEQVPEVKTLGEGGIGEISSEGGTKTITVGEPIKTETLMKPLSKSLSETESI